MLTPATPSDMRNCGNWEECGCDSALAVTAHGCVREIGYLRGQTIQGTLPESTLDARSMDDEWEASARVK